MRLSDWIMVVCRICKGTGSFKNIHNNLSHHCTTCDGHGKVRIKAHKLKEYKL